MPIGVLIELHAGRRRLNLLSRTSGLPSRSTRALSTTKQHAAHHVHQWICLSRDLDAKVLLANLSQSVIPNVHFFNLRPIVGVQLPE